MRLATLSITVVLAATAVVIWYFTSTGHFNRYSPAYAHFVMPTVISLGAFLGWVLLVVQDRYRDGETRCRKCGYILRGLSDPRCPECGERI